LNIASIDYNKIIESSHEILKKYRYTYDRTSKQLIIKNFILVNDYCTLRLLLSFIDERIKIFVE